MFGTRDLEHMADEAWADCRIGHAAYCGQCGYNLYTLSYVGRCPECGNEYSARSRRGVFVPVRRPLPVEYALGVVANSVLAAWLIGGGLRPFSLGAAIMGILSASFGVMCGVKLGQRIQEYCKFREIVRRIEENEED